MIQPPVKIQTPINLHLFRDGFLRSAVERCIAEHHAHYGERLAALYVCGSVHRHEAIPGVSDLDTWVFIDGDYSKADAEWEVRTEEKLRGEIPGFKEMSRAVPVEESLGLAAQPITDENRRMRLRAWFYRLRYDATLVWGRELTQGLEVEPPAPAWARAHFESLHDLARHAAGLKERANHDFKLPQTPFPRLRKLARLGVLSGAYLLMARGEFQSFKASEVLPPLQQLFPARTEFLDTTRQFAVELQVATAEETAGYLAELTAWLNEVEQLFHVCSA